MNSKLLRSTDSLHLFPISRSPAGGFTLVEMLVVIVTLTAVSGLVSVFLGRFLQASHQSLEHGTGIREAYRLADIFRADLRTASESAAEEDGASLKLRQAGGVARYRVSGATILLQYQPDSETPEEPQRFERFRLPEHWTAAFSQTENPAGISLILQLRPEEANAATAPSVTNAPPRRIEIWGPLP